jgi:hypothetical protein
MELQKLVKGELSSELQDPRLFKKVEDLTEEALVQGAGEKDTEIRLQKGFQSN